MKIALSSAPVINRNMEYNLQAMCNVIATAAGSADAIVFGEAALQGFDSLCWTYEKDRLLAISIADEPVQRMCNAAKSHHVAVSFGFIEKTDTALYSSQLFIGAGGNVVHMFRRVSPGWKCHWRTDEHYLEGDRFSSFSYGGKRFAIGLCGDLWTEGRPEEMLALHADVVLWPVWCDYSPAQWNEKLKYEYAAQAALCGRQVLLVNPFCADPGAVDVASGGAAFFCDGAIAAELPAGISDTLFIDL